MRKNIFVASYGSTKEISYQVLNNEVPLDIIEGSEIHFRLKDSSNSSSIKLQKTYSVSGITIVNRTSGLLLITISDADYVNLFNKTYYMEIEVLISDVSYKNNGLFIVEQNNDFKAGVYLRRGTTSQRPVNLTEFDIGYSFFDEDIDSEIIWNGTNWV